MRNKAKKKIRLKSPECLEGDALLKWDEVCDRLSSVGRLDMADTDLITSYCQTWAVNQVAQREMAKSGPIAEYSNGNTGPSPAFKIFQATNAQLRRMWNDMGLTPGSRGPGGGSFSGNAGDLEF